MRNATEPSPPYFEVAGHVEIGFEARKLSPGFESGETQVGARSRHKILYCIFKFAIKTTPTPVDLMQNSDSRHLGGATCKFSGNFHVNLPCPADITNDL